MFDAHIMRIYVRYLRIHNISTIEHIEYKPFSMWVKIRLGKGKIHLDNKKSRKADEPSDRILTARESKSQSKGTELNDGEGEKHGNPNAGKYTRKM